MDPNVFLGMLRHAGAHDAKDFLAEIDVPTLIIAAERDTFTPMELEPRILSFVTTDDVGDHFCWPRMKHGSNTDLGEVALLKIIERIRV